MPTLTDIARAANVSTATVSRALNSQEKGVRTKAAKRAEFIRRLAQDMGYRSLATAAEPQSVMRGHAGFIMRDVYTSPFDFEFIAGATNRLQQADYSLTIITLADLRAKGELLFRESPFDFLIVRHVPAEWRRTIEDLAERCIWLDTNEWRPTHCLRRDEFHAGYLAASEAVKAGCEHLLYLGSDQNEEPHFNVIERRAGAERAAQDANVPLVFMSLTLGQPNPELAADVARLLSPRMAVIASDSGIAQWCAHQSAAAGLLPGHDFGLVSCCETHRVAWTWPQLSRVSFDRRALGAQAAELQLQRLADPSAACTSVKVEGEWIAGTTITPTT